MTMVLAFTVPGEPVAWARARGSGSARFTAPRQKAFKNTLAQFAWAAGARAEKRLPAAVPLALTVRVYLPVPRSWKPDHRAAALAGLIRPVGKPDLDNWVKLPMDALNALVWTDDCQVVEFVDCGKFYSGEPRLEVAVRRLA